MLPTPYLDASEYADYGVPGASAADVGKACRLIDAYLGKPQGLLWSDGADGLPAYMTNASPTASYVLTAPMSPGTSIIVPGARFVPGQAVVTIDRGNPSVTESCAAISADDGTLTLGTVSYAHDAGATIEFGLTLSETERDCVDLPRAIPVVRIFAPAVSPCANRFYANRYAPYELLGDPTYDRKHYHQRHYLAGWNTGNLPFAIKQAVANIINSAAEMQGNVKLMKSGDATIERFAPGFIESDTAALLAPYRDYRI